MHQLCLSTMGVGTVETTQALETDQKPRYLLTLLRGSFLKHIPGQGWRRLNEPGRQSPSHTAATQQTKGTTAVLAVTVSTHVITPMGVAGEVTFMFANSLTNLQPRVICQITVQSGQLLCGFSPSNIDIDIPLLDTVLRSADSLVRTGRLPAGMNKGGAWGGQGEHPSGPLGPPSFPGLCHPWCLTFLSSDHALWQLPLELSTLSTCQALLPKVGGIFHPRILTG